MKRYSIMARPSGQDHEIEICQVDTNPQEIVVGAQKKTLRQWTGERWAFVPRYDHVYFKDNQPE
jgi:hypothetical protein